MIIGLTGMPGSGKTTIAKYLKEKYNFSLVSMSDAVKEKMKSESVEINNDSLRSFSQGLRDKFGMDIAARLTVDYIKHRTDNICIDGIRGPDEIRYFKEHMDGRFYVIGLVSESETRYERLMDRGRADDPHTVEGLKERDQKEIRFGIPEALKIVDFTVSNTASIRELEEKIDSIINSIKG